MTRNLVRRAHTFTCCIVCSIFELYSLPVQSITCCGCVLRAIRGHNDDNRYTMQLLDGWHGTLDVNTFPLLWSWSGKSSQSHAERWSPLYRVYPQRKVPTHIALGGAQWLCAEGDMREDATRAFAKCGGVPAVPTMVCAQARATQCACCPD